MELKLFEEVRKQPSEYGGKESAIRYGGRDEEDLRQDLKDNCKASVFIQLGGCMPHRWQWVMSKEAGGWMKDKGEAEDKGEIC